MVCRRCAAENRDGARFCQHCGASLDEVCLKCGAVLAPDGAFCGGCGAPLTRALEERAAPPQAHVPAYLAARILTSRSALACERKQVTVLFADIKGCLAMLHDRGPAAPRRVH